MLPSMILANANNVQNAVCLPFRSNSCPYSLSFYRCHWHCILSLTKSSLLPQKADRFAAPCIVSLAKHVPGDHCHSFHLWLMDFSNVLVIIFKHEINSSCCSFKMMAQLAEREHACRYFVGISFVFAVRSIFFLLCFGVVKFSCRHWTRKIK